MSLAWHIEALARTKKLPPLHRMLGGKRPDSRHSPDEMLGFLKAMKAGGVPMKIRKKGAA
jgi:hypothetical protein